MIMTIYLFNPACKSAIDHFEMRSGRKLEYAFQPEKNLELLVGKKAFLIDVFHTFIEPIVTSDEDRTYRSLGIEAFMKLRSPRKGFHEFLEYYHNAGKMIGIHSDAMYKDEFENISRNWQFGSSVDRYFDRTYAKCIDEPNKYDERNYVKDFGRMMAESKLDKEQTLIIGDGLSDIKPALYFGVDLLLVPSFNAGRKFDYSELIPK
jgi:hypothetical protein